MESEEKSYQINGDLVSFTLNSKSGEKSVYCKLDEIELDYIDEASEEYKKVQSMIDKIAPLKELVKSTPKIYKDLKIDSVSNNKKAIR